MVRKPKLVAPPPWDVSKLSLKCMVFEDRVGNLVIVEPNRPRLVGQQHGFKLPQMVRIATTDKELESALEEMLYHFQQETVPSTRHLSLIERVHDARDLARGRRRLKAA